jgi:tRNA threonylcarbamoyladenosine biosynthesis protein TsaE
MNSFLDIIINTKSEMKKFGTFLSEILIVGDVITLNGGLGVGKTYLSKTIIKKMTNIKEIPSPTFNLALSYPYKDNYEIYHCDFYRINKFEEVEEIGIFEDLKKKLFY